MRIPFDGLTLAAACAEIQAFAGGRVQGIRQPSDTDVVFELYAGGREALLLLSCHPTFFRAHLATRKPGNQPQPPGFLAALRSRLDGSTLASITQVGWDRILELEFLSARGPHLLVAELMGKHSNLILVDEGHRVVAAAKWVGRSKSVRPIQPGVKYERPPVMRKDEGAGLPPSPFLNKLIEAMGSDTMIRDAVSKGDYHPVLSVGNGAYPVSVAPLGLPELPRPSVSIALEQHYSQWIPASEAESLKSSLLGQLKRVALAREAALSDLRQAQETGHKAGKMQRFGELILAYGPSSEPGASELVAWDYDGAEVRIKLDPELDFKDNANLYFEKAKKAKASLGQVGEQIQRLSEDLAGVQQLIARIEKAERLDETRALEDEARQRRWLHRQPVQKKGKEERPFEGHRVRELMAPGGWTVLYGENAEANDYLTLRVAKPNDWWLHIRGNVSAHVVIATRNHPEKVSREVLLWAAKVAVQHSPSKHSGYVPVDYTLKKYVRKPRSAPKGTALYTHEKTLHVES